ncbi:MAG: tetratricopeptide repeat protein [Dehalococcoidia bacterium]|nr:tetratricopeptide repeat protein [Dehalococcoidia bacterium]
MSYQTSEANLRRQRTREAIELAMQGRWEEAVAANNSVIEIFPNDINAYNRLGKALTELGRYDDAMEAYSQALEIEHNNSIARKNLRRLSRLKQAQPAPGGGNNTASPEIFIEESGKAAVTRLEKLASLDVLAKIAAGDQVYLRPKGQGLVVENKIGEYVGQLQPKIGVRLAKLIEGGNGYTAAIARSADTEVKVIIKEIFQHPSQAGLTSFPAQDYSGFRADIKDSILKYELEDEEGVDSGSYHLEWSEEAEALAEGSTTSADVAGENAEDKEPFSDSENSD